MIRVVCALTPLRPTTSILETGETLHKWHRPDWVLPRGIRTRLPGGRSTIAVLIALSVIRVASAFGLAVLPAPDKPVVVRIAIESGLIRSYKDLPSARTLPTISTRPLVVPALTSLLLQNSSSVSLRSS